MYVPFFKIENCAFLKPRLSHFSYFLFILHNSTHLQIRGAILVIFVSLLKVKSLHRKLECIK